MRHAGRRAAVLLFLKVTSMAFVPGSNEMVILARDELKRTGAMVFKAKGFAKGSTLFSHQ